VENTLLKVTGLTKHFPVSRKLGFRTIHETVRAVDGIDITVNRGENGRARGREWMREKHGRQIHTSAFETDLGSRDFEGADLATLKGEALRELRRDMGLSSRTPCPRSILE